MPITSEKQLAYILHRMEEIVESSEYTAQEKRFRAVVKLGRVLEIVVEDLPQGQQVLVKDVLSLCDKVWPK